MADVLSRRVLVLNRLWQPVNIVGVRRAFGLLMQDHAQVINTATGDFRVMDAGEWITFSIENPPEDDHDCLHTVRLKVRIPAVLLLRVFDRVPAKEVKFNRRAVFERDSFVCQYCGEHFHEKELNLDHVIPRDMGGKTSWENIVTSCIQCNTRKANRLPHKAGMHLKKQPKRPRWRPFVSSVPKAEVEEGWTYFMK
ncbi:HNH endonuclease [Rubellicoccus peritrichatus]|uniref:HNH endonuclease n=1 Tax=Rubellicoccus peritrichatus TaxID=3080537 RepID=A0AAQ3LBJ0_9BACT|nr:HNH endonuclease [Puniceicoccus sp. CR14]WOO41302.1 HNH endonuclease [Puniceicoccus sp. CR14]